MGGGKDKFIRFAFLAYNRFGKRADIIKSWALILSLEIVLVIIFGV